MKGLEYTAINLATGFLLATALGFAIGMGLPALLLGGCFGVLCGMIGFLTDCVTTINYQMYNDRRK